LWKSASGYILSREKIPTAVEFAQQCWFPPPNLAARAHRRYVDLGDRLWTNYKTGAGIEPALLKQFHPLEEALAAMGVVVWPKSELEADDALASAAHIAANAGVTA
jgi:hypothetical protein